MYYDQCGVELSLGDLVLLVDHQHIALSLISNGNRAYAVATITKLWVEHGQQFADIFLDRMENVTLVEAFGHRDGRVLTEDLVLANSQGGTMVRLAKDNKNIGSEVAGGRWLFISPTMALTNNLVKYTKSNNYGT